MAEKQGLNTALDTTKQFVSLASGILTLTITFADKFKPANSNLEVPGALKVAWIAYVLVVFCGMVTLMAVTGTYDRIDKGGDGNATDQNIRNPALVMSLAFLVGIIATVVAGWVVVR